MRTFCCSLLVIPAGFPVGYAAAAPAYNPNVYAGANPAFPSGKNEVCMYKVDITLNSIIGRTNLSCPPHFRLCSGHSFQNVLLSQHRDCPSILLLTQPLSCCCLPSQEHLSPTEPLRTGQCTVVEGLQILALGSGVLPKSA